MKACSTHVTFISAVRESHVPRTARTPYWTCWPIIYLATSCRQYGKSQPAIHTSCAYLIRYSIDNREPIDPTITKNLHKRQRHLRSLRCKAEVGWDAPATTSVDFNHLSTIQLFIAGDYHLDRARALLVAASNLETLEVCIEWSPYLSIAYGQNLDRGEVSNDILRKLLGRSKIERDRELEIEEDKTEK